MADHTSAAGASPTTAVPSPGLYGRACKACAIAKARCVPSTDSGLKCQRCQRLGKSCEQSAAAHRRRLDKKTGRVAKLEEKVNSLVMLLNNASNRAPVGESVEQLSAMPMPQSSSSTSSNMDAIQNLASQNSGHVGDTGSLEMRYGTPIQLSEQGCVSVPPIARTAFQALDEQKFERANILLDKFRTMTDYFPFVVIPSTVDARTLLRERPFLYRTIMAATEQNPNDHRDQVRDIMQYLALHMLQLGEKNLDMLLGILVHIAWSHFHLHAMPRLTNLLHEALALLFDLGLNKAAFRNPRLLVYEDRFVGRCTTMHSATARTLEERRAALGCFFLVSGVASYFQNIEPMRWTPYLEECLGEIQKFNEYNTDASLIMYVRMQRMVEKINSSIWFDGIDQFSEWKLYPPTLYIRAIRGELQTLKNDLQTKFPQDLRLLSHYYSVEMTLYEIGLSKARFPDTAHPSDFQRLEILYACLESVRHFFENFLQIPPATYWNFSAVHFSHLGYALNILQRLSIFEDPAWDLHYVVEKLNFVHIVDQICNRMVEAQRYGGPDPSKISESISLFARIPAKLRKLNAMFEAQIASARSAPDQMDNLDTGDMINLEGMVDFWEQDGFDIMGGNWGVYSTER